MKYGSGSGSRAMHAGNWGEGSTSSVAARSSIGKVLIHPSKGVG